MPCLLASLLGLGRWAFGGDKRTVRDEHGRLRIGGSDLGWEVCGHGPSSCHGPWSESVGAEVHVILQAGGRQVGRQFEARESTMVSNAHVSFHGRRRKLEGLGGSSSGGEENAVTNAPQPTGHTAVVRLAAG